MTEEGSFDSLGLIEPLLRSLREQGYERPTPIQAQAIPIILSGRDLLGTARTGTGKTAAFALPALQKMELSMKPLTPKTARVLVLTPTRELAAQVEDSFRTYGSGTGLTFALAFGGVGKAPQVRALAKGVDVLVATPGRLLDLIGDGAVSLDKVELFVLDEADRMLDMGFIHDMRKVFKLLPRPRQTLLFSATMPDAIVDIAHEILVDPARVAVDPVSAPASGVAQGVYHVDKDRKRALLLAILQDGTVDRALVFTRTKHLANRVARFLSLAGVAADAIHANKSQTHRTRVLSDFKAGALRVLVATDIAARGIDIDELPHVINYEIPNEPETYVHRVGRTARAGLSGTAFSFCGPDERPLVKAIERLTGKPIPLLEMPDLPELPESLLKADARPLNGRGPDDEGGGWGRKRGAEGREGGRGRSAEKGAARDRGNDRPQGGRADKPRDDQPRPERQRRDKPQRESGPGAPRSERRDRDQGRIARSDREADRIRASIRDAVSDLARGEDRATPRPDAGGQSRRPRHDPRDGRQGAHQGRQDRSGSSRPDSDDATFIPPGVSPFHPDKDGRNRRNDRGRKPDRPLSATDIPNISDEEALRRAAMNAAQPGILPYPGAPAPVDQGWKPDQAKRRRRRR